MHAKESRVSRKRLKNSAPLLIAVGLYIHPDLRPMWMHASLVRSDPNPYFIACISSTKGRKKNVSLSVP